MKIIKSIFLISFLITSFSSCGYQLRGSLDIDELKNIKVIASDSNKIAMLLEQKILSYKNDNNFCIAKPVCLDFCSNNIHTHYFHSVDAKIIANHHVVNNITIWSN